MSTITVTHAGAWLVISKFIADQFNLKPFQNIDEATYWAVLRANAEYNIAALTPMLTPQN